MAEQWQDSGISPCMCRPSPSGWTANIKKATSFVRNCKARKDANLSPMLAVARGIFRESKRKNCREHADGRLLYLHISRTKFDMHHATYKLLA
eukprot:scaffold734_cov264-Skeletonema_menzelii.AAC.1